MKVCTKCGVWKRPEEFHKRSASPDGLKPICKACKKKWAAAYYLKNTEELLGKCKRYRDKNPDKESARSKLYYRRNKQKK